KLWNILASGIGVNNNIMRRQSSIRTRIVIETSRTRVFRRARYLGTAWCAACAKETGLMKLDDAAVIFRIEVATFSELLSLRMIHLIEGPAGSVVACLNSLFAVAKSRSNGGSSGGSGYEYDEDAEKSESGPGIQAVDKAVN